MQLGYTIVYVPNVKEAMEFYEKAFDLNRRFFHESGQYGEMETGSTTLGFASNELGKTNLPDGFRENRITEPPAGMELVFVTDDVPRDFKRAIKSGAEALVEPEEKPWGQTVAYVRDLNGVLVEIASPVQG